MSSKGSISAQHVWKRFKEDDARPLLRDRLKFKMPSSRGHRWALRDVGFDIAPGESVGLIGSNGSGKSTLLKVLTQVMYPYAGRVDLHGRVGALIEVRAGIHPDLSGRENVYLYGSLLGLKRREIAAKFDDIVEFAELNSAIDRQVKYYSTGMQMRLGFAVAAFLEPDVLLVDEVLAVGDAAFQQRCLDRMRKVLQSGTTLVLVSHDLASLEAMCTRGLWLDQGVLKADAPMRQVMKAYRGAIEQYVDAGYIPGAELRLGEVNVARPDGMMPTTGQPVEFEVVVKADEFTQGRMYVGVSEGAATPIFVVSKFVRLQEGENRIKVRVEDLPLARGRYSLWTSMVAQSDRDLIPWHHAASFEVIGPELDEAPRAVVRLSPVHVQSEWDFDDRHEM
jgi:ABC-type polysaccharide/polyol phosphate transport system ATPase subunit